MQIEANVKWFTRAKLLPKLDINQACDDSIMISNAQRQTEAKLDKKNDKKSHQKDC